MHPYSFVTTTPTSGMVVVTVQFTVYTTWKQKNRTLVVKKKIAIVPKIQLLTALQTQFL
jgi:hypothetical protein